MAVDVAADVNVPVNVVRRGRSVDVLDVVDVAAADGQCVELVDDLHLGPDERLQRKVF